MVNDNIWCLSGLFLLGIQMLQKYGYVGEIKWDKLGIPISGGLGLGLIAGFIRIH
jgi:hypothetical protein